MRAIPTHQPRTAQQPSGRQAARTDFQFCLLLRTDKDHPRPWRSKQFKYRRCFQFADVPIERAVFGDQYLRGPICDLKGRIDHLLHMDNAGCNLHLNHPTGDHRFLRKHGAHSKQGKCEDNPQHAIEAMGIPILQAQMQIHLLHS